MEPNSSLKKRFVFFLFHELFQLRQVIADLVNYHVQDDEEGPTMTVKEIEEKKRMEKELQQKKVYDFHSDEL